jgi:hypothetical protein
MSTEVGPVLPPRKAAAAIQLEDVTLQADATVAGGIAVVEDLMAKMPRDVGIGHNQPPLTSEEIQEIRDALAILKAKPVEAVKAKAAASTLKKIGEKLGTYLDGCMEGLWNSNRSSTCVESIAVLALLQGCSN